MLDYRPDGRTRLGKISEETIRRGRDRSIRVYLVTGDDDDDDDDDVCVKYPLSSTPASLLFVQTEFQEIL